jgi:hypothetical protein
VSRRAALGSARAACDRESVGTEHTARERKPADRRRERERDARGEREHGPDAAVAALLAPLSGACRACGCGMPCDTHGKRLDGAVAARMGAALGENFDDVRIHTGRDAGILAEHHGALAVTAGREIAFAPGQYRPGTLTGDALLAHELAHAAEQRGADGPRPTTLSVDTHAEASADRAAVGVIGRALGWMRGAGTRIAAGGGGMRLRACSGSEVDAGQRAQVDTAFGKSFGHLAPFMDAHQEKLSGDALRVGGVSKDRDAETSSGSIRLQPYLFASSDPRLAAVVLHEMSHLRDPGTAPMGGSPLEGYGYAFEAWALQDALDRHAAGKLAMTPEAKEETKKRLIVMTGLLTYPPVDDTVGYRTNFNGMLPSLQTLNRIANSQSVDWGGKTPPPMLLAGMSPDDAKKLMGKLLTMPSEDLATSAGTPEAELLKWMRENQPAGNSLSSLFDTIKAAAPAP